MKLHFEKVRNSLNEDRFILKIVLCLSFSLSILLNMSAFASDIGFQIVKQTGILRVCTTGDYPPFTALSNGKYHGQAIMRAERLAKYLHVKVKFIKTTWPTLEKDVDSGKCDIAMGGISSTKSRAKHFLLTMPIQKFGKIPLVRCPDVKKYNNLKKIDRPSVRVVENVGGTNYLFAKERLKYAKLILVKKNADAFRYLLSDRADVMFTDNIEAVYHQKITPRLCAVNPTHPFTTSYKVYILPKKSHELLKQVNRWLQKSGIAI